MLAPLSNPEPHREPALLLGSVSTHLSLGHEWSAGHAPMARLLLCLKRLSPGRPHPIFFEGPQSRTWWMDMGCNPVTHYHHPHHVPLRSVPPLVAQVGALEILR